MRTRSGAVSVARLREVDAKAGFSPPYLSLLLERPSRIAWRGRVLLFDVIPEANPLDLARSLNLTVTT